MLQAGSIYARSPSRGKFLSARGKPLLSHGSFWLTLLVTVGWTVVNVDVTILAERPRLKSYKSKIAAHLREMTGAPVSIKAGTNEGCDAVGRGEAIAAHAVVLLTTAK